MNVFSISKISSLNNVKRYDYMFSKLDNMIKQVILFLILYEGFANTFCICQLFACC